MTTSHTPTAHHVETARARAEALRALGLLAEALRLEVRGTTATGIVDEHQLTLEPSTTTNGSTTVLPSVLVRVSARRQRDLSYTVYAVPPPPFSWRTAEQFGTSTKVWIGGDGSRSRLSVFLTDEITAQLDALSSLQPQLGDFGVTGEVPTRRPTLAAPPTVRRFSSTLIERPPQPPPRAPESLPEHRLQLPAQQAVPLDEMLLRVHSLLGLERVAARAAAGDRVPFVDEATEAMPALRDATAMLALSLTTCPLGFFGELEGYRIDATRLTMIRDRCVIVVEIGLPQHLPGPVWTMWSKGRRFSRRLSSALGTLFRVRAHNPATGDFALDRRFQLVSGSLAPAAAARLVAVREPLIAHADRRWLSVSNDRLRLSLKITPELTTQEVVALVRGGVELARSLGGAAEPRLGEGPYR